jgi:hypothetical protein
MGTILMYLQRWNIHARFDNIIVMIYHDRRIVHTFSIVWTMHNDKEESLYWFWMLRHGLISKFIKYIMYLFYNHARNWKHIILDCLHNALHIVLFFYCINIFDNQYTYILYFCGHFTTVSMFLSFYHVYYGCQIPVPMTFCFILIRLFFLHGRVWIYMLYVCQIPQTLWPI